MALRPMLDQGWTNMITHSELRTHGNRETGEIHYLIDGVEVSKEEYYLSWTEYQRKKHEH
jgi:predicted thioredoxin/glutaredoxin